MDWTIFTFVLVIGLGMVIAAVVGCISQSHAIRRAVESIARQPEAGGRIFASLVIGLALIEALVIYTLLMGLILRGNLGDIIKAKYGEEKLKVEQMEYALEKDKEAEKKAEKEAEHK